MQSFLQYHRTGDYVKSRFSKPSTTRRAQRPVGTPAQNEHARNVSIESVDTLATSRDEAEDGSTISTITNDIEAGSQGDGITLRKRTTREGKGEDLEVLEVGWAGPNDPENPKNWSKAKRVASTLLVAYVTFVCLMASSIDSAVLPQAAKHFGVSPVVESLATGRLHLFFHTAKVILLTQGFSAIRARFCIWIPLHGPFLRNLWAESSLYRLHDLLHDICHGICFIPKHWRSNNFPLLRGRIRLRTTHRCWRLQCRSLEPLGKGVRFPAICCTRFWRLDAWACSRCLYGCCRWIKLALDRLDQPHHGSIHHYHPVALLARNPSTNTPLVASQATPQAYW